jgi:hypothetical protein
MLFLQASVPAFTTSPARWGIISMCTSIGKPCDRPRTVYLAFDATQRRWPAGRAIACLTPREQGMSVRRVSLPDNHDPNGFFVENGAARRFQSPLEAALS